MLDIIIHKQVKCPHCGEAHGQQVQVRALENTNTVYSPGDRIPGGITKLREISGLTRCPGCDKVFTVITPIKKKEISGSVKVSLKPPVISAFEKQQLFIEVTISSVCNKLVVDPEMLTVKSRKQEYVFARQLVWYIVKKKYPKISLNKLARIFLFPDHATVVHAQRKFKNIFSPFGDKEIRQLILETEKEILS